MESKTMDAPLITLTIRLQVGTRRDGKEWMAWCRPLDVFSQGSSKKGAIASLKRAIALWFESCIQRGVLDQALREAGFKRREKLTTGVKTFVHAETRKAKLGADYIEISVPAYIAAHQLERASASR